MAPGEEPRWKQRFQNFSRAFALLSGALDGREISDFSDLEKEGIVQRFEYAFELAWITFKDYLDFSGLPVGEASPRKIIKQCAESGIFAAAGICPEAYMEMMLDRNLLSHTCDLERSEGALARIKNRYVAELDSQRRFFAAKEIAGP